MKTDMWTHKDRAVALVDLTGFEVEASDGKIGKVDEATSEVGAAYIVVDVRPWLPLESRVVLPAGLIEMIDVEDRTFSIQRTKDEVRNAPSFDPGRGVDESYRTELDAYYTPETSGRRQPARQARKRGSGRSTGRRSPQSRRGRQSDEPTKQELYEQAKRLDIPGRSKKSKAQLAQAVGRARSRGQSTAQSRSKGRAQSRSQRRSGTKAHPVEVQAFLEGVKYPTGKRELAREASRQGAQKEVRSTIDRLPDERFQDPTEVSEAISRVR